MGRSCKVLTLSFGQDRLKHGCKYYDPIYRELVVYGQCEVLSYFCVRVYMLVLVQNIFHESFDYSESRKEEKKRPPQIPSLPNSNIPDVVPNPTL